MRWCARRCYEAANVLLIRAGAVLGTQRLGDWASPSGEASKRAKVALARKIAVILHRMWVDGTNFRWSEAKLIAARLDQGGIRDASGPNRAPCCPKSRRRDAWNR